ncbi:MAG: PAS domain S-box protein [Opitutaceae bacterium]|jgi:PAS domain S-box-containing protein
MRAAALSNETPHPTALAAAVIQSHYVAPWENSNYLACVREMSGKIVAVNLAFARKFGRAAPSWAGRDIATLVHPDDLSGWRSLVTSLAQAPHRIEHETRWMTAQGWRWLSWEETAFFDEEGKPNLYRAIGRDVTKQRQAEEHAYKLTSAVEQSPVSTLIADLHGHVHYVNPKFTAVTGYSLEEIMDQNLPLLREGHESEESYSAFLDTIRAGREWRGEVRTRKKDGGTLWETIQVSPIRNPVGEITHLLCLREDVSERKRLEEQLRQSQKMESLGTLAGGIAHDFNNMLAIINGYTEVCLARTMANPGDDTLRRYLREVHSAAQRAVGLVQRILTFSRKTEVRIAPIALNKLVRELGALLAETFPRTITFDYDLEENIPMLLADQNQLQQVIMNLCVNARDAMAKGGGRLTLTTRIVKGSQLARLGADSSLVYVCLRVTDTGSGMTPQVRARIFEPFFTTKQEAGGTGLGLAVVYGIILNHRGLLEVESTPEQGSSFSAYLPSSGLDTAPQAAQTPRTFGELPQGTESVLVVEDELSLRTLLCSVLEPCGYHVQMAQDGRAAVQVLENKALSVDAVLLDLNMPELHGMEVFKEIKRLRPKAKVLVVSGNVTKDVKAELMKLGQREFIAKPYRIEEVCTRLRHILDEKPA